MGFTEILTIIFVICKLVGLINWSWWLVLLPEIIAAVFYLIIFVIQIFLVKAGFKKLKKH